MAASSSPISSVSTDSIAPRTLISSLEETRELVLGWDPFPKELKASSSAPVSGSHRTVLIQAAREEAFTAKISELAKILLRIRLTLGERVCYEAKIAEREEQAKSILSIVEDQLSETTKKLGEDKKSFRYSGFNDVEESFLSLQQSQGLKSRLSMEYGTVKEFAKQIQEYNLKVVQLFKEGKESFGALKELQASGLQDEDKVYPVLEATFEQIQNFFSESTWDILQKESAPQVGRARSKAVSTHNQVREQ